MWLTDRINTLRANSQLFYSLILIVIIPSILAFNTLYIVRAVDRDMNDQLRKSASLVGNIIAPSIEGLISDRENLELRLLQIAKSTEGEIANISVLEPNQVGDAFSLVATTNPDNAQSDESLLINQIAWGGDKAYASQVPSVTGGKLWTVVAPVKNLSGQKIALINVKISTLVAEQTISRTIRDSLLVMVGTIFAVLLLLLNHIRFFETSVMFSKLKEVNKLKDVFISVASHELLSPMTAIKGYLELLKDSPLPKTKEVSENIKYLSDNFDRLQELVMDLLDVSRIENNKIFMTLKPLNIEEMIKDVLTQFALLAQEKNLKLEYTVTLGLPPIMGDERRLRQVLTNIVSNAIKYTKEGGLTISQEFDPKLVTIHFRDTGIGIADSERTNLFQKFYRVRSKETENIPGTGLGLWLIKQFVEKMGGKIYVESIQHSGTQVTLVLPIAKGV